ncbi:MBL fold metallo-hydrolase [soil metagenome]
MSLDIKKFEVGPFAENTYLVSGEGQSLLIDPGFSNENEFRRFHSALANLNSTLTAVLLTHAHVDHVLGLPAVLKKFDPDVYLSHEDLNPWNHLAEQAAMFGLKADNLAFTPKDLPEQSDFSMGPFKMDLLHTPGHAPDHISIYFKEEKILIAGDTLFKGSVGRTDLYKGDMELLVRSIRDKIYILPDETMVYPGHGPATTVGEEKRTNPFVKA